MRQLEHAQGARHAHRPAAGHGLRGAEQLAVAVQEQALGGGGRRGFEAVVGIGGLVVGIEQQRAAAEARGLRLGQRQHQLRGDRGIHRAAAGLEDLGAGLRGERVRGDDHRARRGPARLVAPAAGGLGDAAAEGRLRQALRGAAGRRGAERGRRCSRSRCRAGCRVARAGPVRAAAGREREAEPGGGQRGQPSSGIRGGERRLATGG